MPARVPVTAVLVAHDGSRWLPEVLSALASSTVQPARVVAVDTGSTDGSAELLRQATGHVLTLPPDTGYAAAVHAALASVPADTRWVWLLHDDSAPDPQALAHLLRAAGDAALLGPKAVDWDDPRVLVEIGCSTDASGVRDTGLEPGELDQGQHDGVRDVLAVGTAGALVRRDVWDALGGLDPALPLFRDDVDLGRRVSSAGQRVVAVPQARVRHVRAASRGLRQIACAPGTPAAIDRRAALHVLLAHTPWLPLVLLRVLASSALRAAARLLLRQPRAAWDELTAPLSLRPGRVRAARRARAATRVVPHAALRPLMASPWRRLRARATALADRTGSRPVPAVDEPAQRRRRWRPGLVLPVLLAVLALVAARDLLGGGVLTGGRLLPAPDDLWAQYARTRDPALAVLALPGLLVGGRVVDLLLLGCVPLAGAVAYAVAGRVVRSVPLRLWAGATWALLPVGLGAVAAGRLDAAAVHVALPALLLGGSRLVPGRLRPVGYGLALTAATALAPLLWPLAVLLLGAGTLGRLAAAAPALRRSARRQARGVTAALAVPPLLLLPWSPGLLDAGALLHGPGRVGPGLADAVLPAWHVLLVQPGGPGTPATLVTGALLLGALGGLLRTRRARVAAAAWGLALAGFAAALVLARTTVGGAPVWPGIPLDLAAAGLLLAALVGAEGLQESLSRASFGARQLAAVAVVVLAAAVPVLCAGDWLRRGADRPLERAAANVLPAFVQAELAARPGTRALLLSARPDGTVAYAVSDADGPRLGDRPVRLDDVVADLVTPRGTAAAQAAAGQGISFVVADSDLPALDVQPDLDRRPGDRPLWRVAAAVTPVREPEPAGLPLPLQALAAAVAAVLAAPAPPPRRGLEREPRR